MNQEKGNYKVQFGSKIETKETKSIAENNLKDCAADFDQCFSGNSFHPQYEEECPVNYSLKYTETESCKASIKDDSSKEKFKLYPPYGETDLEQSANFNYKYAENNYCGEVAKDSTIIYYPKSKSKYKSYADYAETDLDQLTDFTLKYHESVEEDIKKPNYNFYENSKGDTPNSYVPLEDTEDPLNIIPDETPLMFSRCSSLNSLSSFVHITQSIPDDMSSVVSDFSRMTSGIISPSDLPDSPTQTTPSSPKKIKLPFCFSAKAEISSKKSVFEDDVATYKQEDTPIEFSRATSLSSLNVDNLGKSDFECKGNLITSLVRNKDQNQNSIEQLKSKPLKNQDFAPNTYLSKENLGAEFDEKLDENLFSSNIKSGVQGNKINQIFGHSLKKKVDGFGSQELNKHSSCTSEFVLKQNLQHKVASETEKDFSAFEISDDIVHTYHTEGTPANISYAGSQSDLSSPLVSSDEPYSGLEISGKTAFYPAASYTSNVKSRYDYLGKDPSLNAKDETAMYITENSPNAFSVRSSFNDLTISLVDSPFSVNRSENCEDSSLTPLHNVSPQSPNFIALVEKEEQEKESGKPKIGDFRSGYWMEKNLQRMNENVNKFNKNFFELKDELCEKPENMALLKKTLFDFYSNEPLTPFEEALLEQCIRLGMPQTKKKRNLENISNSSYPAKETSNSRDNSKEKFSISKQCKINADSLDNSYAKNETVNIPTMENFDFDSEEPLTLFEEALLEQCILLGMCRKHNPKLSTQEKGAKEKFFESYSEPVTSLEAALLEQCIRMGMPQKKMSKKLEENYLHSSESHNEPHIISVGAELNKLRISEEKEKIVEGSEKNEHSSCFCRKKYKRKNSASKKFKKKF